MDLRDKILKYYERDDDKMEELLDILRMRNSEFKGVDVGVVEMTYRDKIANVVKPKHGYRDVEEEESDEPFNYDSETDEWV